LIVERIDLERRRIVTQHALDRRDELTLVGDLALRDDDDGSLLQGLARLGFRKLEALLGLEQRAGRREHHQEEAHEDGHHVDERDEVERDVARPSTRRTPRVLDQVLELDAVIEAGACCVDWH